VSKRPKTAPGLAPAHWHGYARDCEERIAELEAFVAAYDDYRALFIVPSTSHAFMRLEEAREALESDE
jgi:hypothetical protein